MTFDDDPEKASFGLGDLLSQVQQMQELLASAQAEASDQIVIGRAGDGAVEIGVTGGLEFRTVKIDPTVVDQGDASLLEDLVLVALHDAMAQVGELNLSAMQHSGLEDIAGLAGLDLDDIGLGGLTGLGGIGEPTPGDDATVQSIDSARRKHEASSPDEQGKHGPAD